MDELERRLGGSHRLGPTGGSAKGMDLNCRVFGNSGSMRPVKFPVDVLTVRLSATTELLADAKYKTKGNRREEHNANFIIASVKVPMTFAAFYGLVV